MLKLCYDMADVIDGNKLTVKLIEEVKRMEKKNEQFIKDLLGYITQATLQETVEPYVILANIAHDLNEWHHNRHEPWFSPRTAGMAQFITQD